MNKLNKEDTMKDVLIKMSEGNPGCIVFLVGYIKNNPLGILPIIDFDDMNLYGENLYKLWNDCCKNNYDTVNKVLDAWRKGKLTTQEIIENVSKPYGTPFDI